jgi:hypothetical protein
MNKVQGRDMHSGKARGRLTLRSMRFCLMVMLERGKEIEKGAGRIEVGQQVRVVTARLLFGYGCLWQYCDGSGGMQLKVPMLAWVGYECAWTTERLFNGS